jgi:aldehyde dehydrogenase (NAD+)
MGLADTQMDAIRIRKAFETHQKAINRLKVEDLDRRKARLIKLKNWIHRNRTAIHQAMFKDFQKPSVEVDAIEIYHVLNEIKHALTHLDAWASPKKIDAPFTMLGTRSAIYYEPRGVCLIISPWNYPFTLTVGPLVSALAAGNAVMLKPSELTPHVSALTAVMVSEVFENDVVTIFEGEANVSAYLLTLPFNHIFFTGSPAVGKLVMKAAADHLTSVTLELGGKSPTIVTASANLNDAAQRIAAGKFINNGQTCIAPDYVFVDEKIAVDFTKRVIEETKNLFSEKGNFKQSQSYCRIVNERHFLRLNGILEDGLKKGAKLDLGGDMDASSRFFSPVVLTNIPRDSRLMEEEIFGPILPIITYKEVTEAIHFINSKPVPLALYLFANDSKMKNKILKETSSGGVCINDCAIHFLNHNLPFGGVNNSGIGKSHGYYGFLAFSNEKPVLHQKGGFTPVKVFYPPYTLRSRKIMDWFLKLF